MTPTYNAGNLETSDSPDETEQSESPGKIQDEDTLTREYLDGEFRANLAADMSHLLNQAPNRKTGLSDELITEIKRLGKQIDHLMTLQRFPPRTVIIVLYIQSALIFGLLATQTIMVWGW